MSVSNVPRSGSQFRVRAPPDADAERGTTTSSRLAPRSAVGLLRDQLGREVVVEIGGSKGHRWATGRAAHSKMVRWRLPEAA